jgi:hypothetical protein
VAPNFVNANLLVSLAYVRAIRCGCLELLRRIKRPAADRDPSISSLMTDALARLADEERRYSAARKRALAALGAARSLGSDGYRTWTRNTRTSQTL